MVIPSGVIVADQFVTWYRAVQIHMKILKEFKSQQLKILEDCWLFTGSKTELMQDLVGESLHSAALNSGCSSTVAEEWLKCYFNTLHPESLAQVTQKKSHTVFKFGDSQLKSMEKVQFPCEIAGQKCFITTDVVKK